jgi:hypothetical protein
MMVNISAYNDKKLILIVFIYLLFIQVNPNMIHTTIVTILFYLLTLNSCVYDEHSTYNKPLRTMSVH